MVNEKLAGGLRGEYGSYQSLINLEGEKNYGVNLAGSLKLYWRQIKPVVNTAY